MTRAKPGSVAAWAFAYERTYDAKQVDRGVETHSNWRTLRTFRASLNSNAYTVGPLVRVVLPLPAKGKGKRK